MHLRHIGPLVLKGLILYPLCGHHSPFYDSLERLVGVLVHEPGPLHHVHLQLSLLGVAIHYDHPTLHAAREVLSRTAGGSTELDAQQDLTTIDVLLGTGTLKR